MAALSLALLGAFEARRPGGAALALPKKTRALLAYLALHLGDACPRRQLATLLWGDAGEAQARQSLRQALKRLRAALSSRSEALRIDGSVVALDPKAIEVDTVTFERLIADGGPAALERPVTLYRGELLAGLDLDEKPFDEWLVGQRERLREMAMKAVTQLLASHIEAGAADEAVLAASRLLAIDPLHEAAHRALMRFHAAQGRRSVALRQYQTCVEVLQRELGVEPEADTKQLYQEIVRERVAPSPRASHESLLGPPQEPAVAPTPTPLVGREAERRRLGDLTNDVVRGRGGLVTILGEAGIGKTRLVRDRLRTGRLHSQLAFHAWWTGEPTRAREFAAAALAVAEETADLPLSVTATLVQGYAAQTSGDYRVACDILGPLVERLRSASSQQYGAPVFPYIGALSHLALACAHLGDSASAVSHQREALAFAETIDHWYSVMIACWARGDVCLAELDPEDAAIHLERALALSHEWEIRLVRPNFKAALGWSHVLAGRLAEGRALMREALSEQEALGSTYAHCLLLVRLGDAALRANDLREARAFADRALGLTRARTERGIEAWALRLLGAISAGSDPPDVPAGESYFREALARAGELGMRPLVGMCHLGLARLHAKAKNSSDAREHLAAAGVIFRELGMRSWQAETEALGPARVRG